MVGCQALYNISGFMNLTMGIEDTAFARKNMIFAGDLAQLPPPPLKDWTSLVFQDSEKHLALNQPCQPAKEQHRKGSLALLHRCSSPHSKHETEVPKQRGRKV